MEANMLEVGNKAPSFTLVGDDGKEYSLEDYKGKKVLLYFYPKDNTPGCTAEACSLRNGYAMLQKAGYQVIGVSKDSEASHQKFAAKYGHETVVIPVVIGDGSRKIC